MSILANAAIVAATTIAMEAVATLVHKHVMHGWGWAWHRSHHEPRDGAFERNDLYAFVFAALSVGLIYLGSRGVSPLTWVGVGMAVYGLIYFVFHDGVVHQRWPFRFLPRSGYLKRLVQAHRLHHAVQGREGCVSFGFLYAAPVGRLRRELRERMSEERARQPVPETAQKRL